MIIQHLSVDHLLQTGAPMKSSLFALAGLIGSMCATTAFAQTNVDERLRHRVEHFLNIRVGKLAESPREYGYAGVYGEHTTRLRRDFARKVFDQFDTIEKEASLNALLNEISTGGVHTDRMANLLGALGPGAAPVLERLKRGADPNPYVGSIGPKRSLREIERARAGFASAAVQIEASLRETPMSLDRLEGLISSKKPTTIEEASEIVADGSPHLVNLMYKTGGLQSVDISQSFLRAIATKTSGKFIFAVAGTPETDPHTGLDGRSIEIAAFDDQRNAWERSAILIRKEASGQPRAILFRQAQLSAIGLNCARCHGDDHNLRWGPYGHWPRAIGSADDYLYDNGHERRLLSDFINVRANEGVYKPIGISMDLFGTAKDRNIEITNIRYLFADNIRKPSNPLMEDNRDLTWRMVDAPNTVFGNIASYHAAWRMVRRMREALGGQYENYKYAIMAGLAFCDHFENFIPEGTRRLHAFRYSDLLRDMESRMDPYKNSIVVLNPYFGISRPVAALRYIFEGRGAGVDPRVGIQRWFPAQTEFPYADKSGGTPGSASALAREILTILDPDLSPPPHTNPLKRMWSAPNQCDFLKTKSLEALATIN